MVKVAALKMLHLLAKTQLRMIWPLLQYFCYYTCYVNQMACRKYWGRDLEGWEESIKNKKDLGNFVKMLEISSLSHSKILKLQY